MPVFRFNKALGIARDLKAFLNLHAGVTRGAVPDVDLYEEQAKKLRIVRQENRQRIKEQKKKIAQKQQEISRLKNELRAAEERAEAAIIGRAALQADGASKTGALADLDIAGAQKGAMIVSAGRSEPNSPSVDIPRLVVRPRGGLANRMRVITSFQILARRSGRVFELCWSPSNGWSEEDLNYLFENGFPRVPIDEFERYCQNGLALHQAFRTVERSNERTRKWREGSGMHQVFDLEAFPMVTYSGHIRCDALVDPATRARLFPHFASAYRASVKEWSPVPTIRAEVERLTEAFRPHTVGVHIRRGDAWNRPAASLAARQYRRSSDSAFFARMDAELAAEPRTNFFLATDCAATEKRFREHYGEAVVVNRDKEFVPSVPKQPKDNQRDAVIDMFALARTRKILGNNYSSFSEMAASIGGIRLERVLED